MFSEATDAVAFVFGHEGALGMLGRVDAFDSIARSAMFSIDQSPEGLLSPPGSLAIPGEWDSRGDRVRPFGASPLPRRSVADLRDMRPLIQLASDRREPSAPWSVDRQQAFIEGLINGVEGPAIFIEVVSGHPDTGPMGFRFADGRRRIESVWGFLEGEFALSEDFEFDGRPDWRAGGLTHQDLTLQFPVIATRLLQAELPIVVLGAAPAVLGGVAHGVSAKEI